MIPQAFTYLLVSACEASVQMHHSNSEVELGRMQLRALEMQIDHQTEIAEIQASLARDMIRALITQRIEAVQSSFNAILAMYAEQARHYMQQHDKFAEAAIKATTPREQANYYDRLSAIDDELGRIRQEANLLYQEMNTMLLAIGRQMPPLGGSGDQNTLMLR